MKPIRKKARTVPLWLFWTASAVSVFSIATGATTLLLSNWSTTQARKEGWCTGYYMATEGTKQAARDVRKRIFGPITPLAGNGFATEPQLSVLAVLGMVDRYVVPAPEASFQDEDTGVSFSCRDGDVVEEEPTRRKPDTRNMEIAR